MNAECLIEMQMLFCFTYSTYAMLHVKCNAETDAVVHCELMKYTQVVSCKAVLHSVLKRHTKIVSCVSLELRFTKGKSAGFPKSRHVSRPKYSYRTRCWMALKSDRRLRSTPVETPVKFHSHVIILNTDLAASRFDKI